MRRWQRLRAPVLVGGGVALATVALRLRDPHQPGSWGICPSRLLGVYCPGCGSLRAVNDLTHGQVADAASSNLLLLLAGPLALWVFVLWTRARWRGIPWNPSPSVLRDVTWAVIAVSVVFAVVRNLPVGAWLAP